MSDEKWGEHEIDYVLFIKKDVNVKANPNEVKSYRFVNQEKMKEVLQDAVAGKIIITPWFDLLCEQFLFIWWENVGNLESVKDTKTIHKMIKNWTTVDMHVFLKKDNLSLSTNIVTNAWL